VVKKQLISYPPILSFLRRLYVHPARVFGAHVGKDVPNFALVILEGPSGMGVKQNRESNPFYTDYRKTFSFQIRKLFPIV
jgi:hypothetical protein